MSRWQAAGLHLLISLFVAALLGSLIYFIWYPQPYFDVAGGSTLLLVMAGVNITIGPFSTLAVFRSGKAGLRFDLMVIVLVQIAALGYGMEVIAEARPVFVVAETDRFVVVSANQLDDADLSAASAPEFRSRSWSGPRLVGAISLDTYESAMSAFAGKDIDRQPQYFVPYAQVTETLLAHSRPLNEIMAKSAKYTTLVQNFLSAQGTSAADYRVLPVQSRKSDYSMLVSAKTGQPLAALAIDPW